MLRPGCALPAIAMHLPMAAIAFDETLIDTGEVTGPEEDSQLLWNAIDRLLSLPQPPTVFCCGNDKMALRVYGILRSRGSKCPTKSPSPATTTIA